jgi:hypothetical protein
MPELSRFFGIIIKMYYEDHNPPHFHAEYQEFSSEYDIRTLQKLAGNLPSRAHGLVLEWASYHREQLLENWDLAANSSKLKKIDPLQ